MLRFQLGGLTHLRHRHHLGGHREVEREGRVRPRVKEYGRIRRPLSSGELDMALTALQRTDLAWDDGCAAAWTGADRPGAPVG